MTEPTVSVAPRYLAASTRDRHRQHLATLAGTSAWTLEEASFTTTVTSTCGHVTLHADRTATSNEAHLFLHARTRPGAEPRWSVTLGGELPVEFLASMTTVLTAELLRDPDYILYGLPPDGRPFTLRAPTWDPWQSHDRDLLEWRTRHRGSRAVALMRGRQSTAPPLAGGEDTFLMAAATLPATIPGTDRPEVLWWAAFSHGTPPAVAGTFLNDLLSPEPLVRTTSDLPRPQLLPLLVTSRPAAPPTRPALPVPRGGGQPGPGRRAGR